MQPPSSSRLRARPLLACGLIALVTLATYWPVLGHDAVWWDDPDTLFDNPAFNPPTLAALGRYWTRDVWGLYAPVVYTVWYPLAKLAWHVGPPQQLDPRVFHAANLVVHVMCALVIFALMHALLRRLSGDRSTLPAAAIGAILFAVHPVQVESVAWISGMKDLLCGLFAAVALWLYVLHASIPLDDGARAGSRLALYMLATAAFAAALLSKPVAVAVPLMALALDRGLLGRSLGGAIGSLVPWIVLALPIMYITRAAQPIPVVYEMSPWPLRPIVAGDALAFYVRKILFPAKLAMDYGRSPDVIAEMRFAWLAWLVPVALAALLWLLRRRAWPVMIGAILFAIPLIPVLGLVPFGAQVYSSVTDHYLYLPMIGLALIAAWCASRVRARVALAIAMPVLAILATRSWFQTWHWQDTQTLFTHNLRINPRSWTSHINLAAHALLQGRPDVAEHHSREALSLRPDDGQIYLNLAMALYQQQRAPQAVEALDRAIELFTHSLRTNPDQPDVKHQLARAQAMRRAATQPSVP